MRFQLEDVFITSYQMGAASPALFLVSVSIDPVGQATVRGLALLRPGPPLPPRLLVAGGGTAQCADANGDGRGGLARMTIAFRDARSGEAVEATIIPDDGDLAESGVFGATIRLIDPSFSSPVRLLVRYARD